MPAIYAAVIVQSYANEAAYNDGSGAVWNESLEVPMSAFAQGPQGVEAYIAADGVMGYAGGTVVADGLDTLDSLKLRKWAAIKDRREQVEFGGFTWDGSVFDSDAESQSRIQGASQLATLAMLSSSNFSVDWTLADNTVRTLSIANMLAVGQAMGVHIMTTHGVGRGLRAAIEAATTTAAVEAVTWPV